MGCNCGKSRRLPASKPVSKNVNNVMGNYKYLKPHQVKARLEIFKKKNCTNCKKRYVCDINMYKNCKGQSPKVA